MTPEEVGNVGEGHGSISQEVAVLADWRKEHQEEHKQMWLKIGESATALHAVHIMITELKTKLTIYVGVAVFAGSLVGQVVIGIILHAAKK